MYPLSNKLGKSSRRIHWPGMGPLVRCFGEKIYIFRGHAQGLKAGKNLERERARHSIMPATATDHRAMWDNEITGGGEMG